MKGFIRKRECRDGRSYQANVKIDGRVVSLGTFKLKKDADARLKRAEAEIAAGTFGREYLTFGTFYERWIASKHNLKPSTRVSYEQTFRLHILPAFTGKRLEQITPLDVQAWIDDLTASGMNPSTVARCFRNFRGCMKQAEAWELINKAPTVKINLPRKDNNELEFLDVENILRLLEAAREPERVLFAVLAMSGLRLGEGLALRWRDVDFEMRAIKVTRAWNYHGGFQEPKTATSRRAVPLIDALADILRDYYHGNGHPALDDLLFTHDGSRPLDPANVRKRFLEALDAAGLRRVTIHSLRHSYASLLLSYGASVKAVQNALGHASATMTLNVYSHFIPSEIDDAALARMSHGLTGAEGKLVRFPRRDSDDSGAGR